MGRKHIKYISDECEQCDEYSETYGCMDGSCQIRQDYETGMKEMAADFECDKMRERDL